MSDAASGNASSKENHNADRESRKKKADEMRKSSHRAELARSIRSILKQVKDDNPIGLFKRLLDEGTPDAIQNEILELRRILDVDNKLKRLSSKTVQFGIALLKFRQPLVEGKKQLDRFQHQLKEYRSADKRDGLTPQEQMALRTLVLQLRTTLQNYNLIRDQAFKLYTSYCQGRRKDMGEEAALRHSTEFYLQFVDAPQRARIEIQMKEKMGSMRLEPRIDALKVFVHTIVQISPSIRDAEMGRSIEMARHFLEENHIDDAVAELQRALEYQESADVYLELAECWKREGVRDREIEALKKASSCSPDSVEPLLRLAQLYEEEGESVSALSAYNKILELRPDRISALTHAALLAFEAQQWPTAVKWLTRVLQQKPKSKKTVMRLGVALVRTGELERGFALLHECKRREMEDGAIDLHLGMVYRRQGHFDDARAAFEIAARKEPKNRDALFWLTQSEFDAGDYEKAEKRCPALLALQKRDPDALLLYGRILNVQKRGGEALKFLRPLARGADSSDEIRLEYGKSCLHAKELDEAYRTVKDVVDRSPNYGEARELMGLVCIESGRFDEVGQYMVSQ